MTQWTGRYLDLGGGGEDGVVWVFQTVLFEPLRLGADEQVEVCCQVASQQGFVGRNVEQEGERFHVEARLQHLQREADVQEASWREVKEGNDFLICTTTVGAISQDKV